MTTKKNLKTHTSTQKKSSTPSATSTRTRKAASKASKLNAKSKAAKKKRREELNDLALRMFQMVYEDYQQGKFHRIL